MGISLTDTEQTSAFEQQKQQTESSQSNCRMQKKKETEAATHTFILRESPAL